MSRVEEAKEALKRAGYNYKTIDANELLGVTLDGGLSWSLRHSDPQPLAVLAMCVRAIEAEEKLANG